MKILTEDSSYELSHFRGGLPSDENDIPFVRQRLRDELNYDKQLSVPKNLFEVTKSQMNGTEDLLETINPDNYDTAFVFGQCRGFCVLHTIAGQSFMDGLITSKGLLNYFDVVLSESLIDPYNPNLSLRNHMSNVIAANRSRISATSSQLTRLHVFAQ